MQGDDKNKSNARISLKVMLEYHKSNARISLDKN